MFFWVQNLEDVLSFESKTLFVSETTKKSQVVSLLFFEMFLFEKDTKNIHHWNVFETFPASFQDKILNTRISLLHGIYTIQIDLSFCSM